MKKILSNNKNIEAFGIIKSVYFGPNSVLLALDVNFINGLSTDQLEMAVIELENEIEAKKPFIDKIYIESRAFKQL